MQVALNRLEVEASGSPSARSVRSSRALEGAVRLRDLASPVRPRSMRAPRSPSPGRGHVPEAVVHRLEEHDDQQVCTVTKAVEFQQSIQAVFSHKLHYLARDALC